MQERFGQTVPMGRAGHVDEMAGAAIFLASSLSSYITGQTIHVDGGTQAASGWYHHPRTGEYVLGPDVEPARPTRPFRSAVPARPGVGTHATVDGDQLSRDVAGLVRGEKHDDVCHVVGLADRGGQDGTTE